MIERNNREYYIDRAKIARQLAANAADPSISKIHLEMAERYERIVGEAEQVRDHRKLHLVRE